MSFVLSHTKLGFCWWDLLALIVLVVVVGIFVVNHKKMKDRTKELEAEVSALYAPEEQKEETVQ